MSIPKFITTNTGTDPLNDTLSQNVVSFVHSQRISFQNARLTKEATWLECWSSYLGTPQSIEFMRGQMLRHVGDTNNDWRHHINVGKAFENTETILYYLQQAFFPNKDWFDAMPMEAGYWNLATAVKKLTQKKLREGKFISNWEMFLRQMLIVGDSCLALPWRYETTKWKKKVKVENPVYGMQELGERQRYKEVTVDKVIQNKPDFEVLDMFDVYVSPKACDPNEGNFIRRLYKSRAEIAQCIQSGYFTGATMGDLIAMHPGEQDYEQSTTNKEAVRRFQGIETGGYPRGVDWSEEIELYEFWGDVQLEHRTYHDVRAIVCGTKLLRFETNPYWCGKPFVVGNYIPVVRSPVGIGVIEPTLGMLHELNIITNNRLDNLLLSNCMWEYINDGSLQPDEIYSAPGKVFSVTQKGTITPIEMPNMNIMTYEETSFLEQRIDKSTGVGNMISAGAARDGERVTAQEIQATKSAGGNRLSGVHKHIEETALTLVLSKVFRQLQQFITQDEIVAIPGMEPGDVDYVAIGVEELQFDFLLTPVGADHVVDKEYKLNKLLQFLQISSQYPETQKNVNYINLQMEIAKLLDLDEIDRFVVEGINPDPSSANAPGGGGAQMEASADPTQSASPGMEGLNSELYGMGGAPLQNAVNGQISVDGGAGMLGEISGQPMTAESAPPLPI
jgi:hypothetical protein